MLARGIDGTGDQAVGVAEHHEHCAEVAGVGQLLAGLLFGHALLGAQLAQLGNHGLQDVLVIHGLETGAVQELEAELLAAGQNGILIAHDDEIHNLTLEQVVSRLDNAVFLTFRQHNSLLVALGLAEQVELEGIRGDGCGVLHIERCEHFIGGGVLAEGRQRQILGGFVGERNLGKRPDGQTVLGEGFLDGEGVARFTAGHENAEHLVAGGFHALDGQMHGLVQLVRPAVDGAHGQEHAGLQVGGHIRIEFVAGRIIDMRLVGADDQCGIRTGHIHGVVEGTDDVTTGGALVGAHLVHVKSGRQSHAKASIGRGEQNGGEVVVVGHGRTEHHGLVLGSQCIEHAVRNDVAAISAFGAGDIYTGHGHCVCLL